LAFPQASSLVRAGISKLVRTIDKVHSPDRSNQEAGAFSCNILPVLPSCPIPNPRQVELGPELPANRDGATGLEYSAQRGSEEFSIFRSLGD
jgi:hypothetical protein